MYHWFLHPHCGVGLWSPRPWRGEGKNDPHNIHPCSLWSYQCGRISHALTWQWLQNALWAFQEGVGVATHHDFQSLFSIPFLCLLWSPVSRMITAYLGECQCTLLLNDTGSKGFTPRPPPKLPSGLHHPQCFQKTGKWSLLGHFYSCVLAVATWLPKTWPYLSSFTIHSDTYWGWWLPLEDLYLWWEYEQLSEQN